jgi:hypothetical protein
VYILGEINFKIIFSVFFFLLVGVYAIIAKVIRGVKRLVTRTPTKKSFWIEKKYAEPTIENMRRQF